MIETLRRLFGLGGPAAVLTTDERFNAGKALAASALSTFDAIVEDLTESNDHLRAVAVETADKAERIRAEAQAEIDRLSKLAEDATAQQSQNNAVIGNVRRLITPAE